MSEFPDLLVSVTKAELQRLEIPADIAEESAQRLLDALQRLAGGERHYLPAPSRDARDRAIRAALAAGESRASVARRLGLHVATVDRVRRR